MTKLLIMDPASIGRSGKHNLYGTDYDALAGNISRVFLTGVPQSVPTTDCRQPDNWSCGAYALAECLGQGDGENARQWLLDRGLINQEQGTYYSGIVGYLNSCGYDCIYDGKGHDGQMSGSVFNQIIDHMNSGYKVILCMHGTSKGCRTDYWTKSGHYIVAYGIDNNGIVVNGEWDKKTTKLAQHVFGTTEDSIISNQNIIMREHLPNCKTSSWKFVKQDKLKNGSELIRAIQRMLHLPEDGFFGIITLVALQKFLNVYPDGFFGNDSVCAFQNWLNNQV